MLKNLLSIAKRTLNIAILYGKRRLAIIVFIQIVSSFFSLLSVAAIVPFFSLASDTLYLSKTSFGQKILSAFPNLQHQQFMLVAGCSLIAILIISSLISMGAIYARLKYIFGLQHFLRGQTLTGLAKRPYSFFLQNNSGVILQKTRSELSIFVSNVAMPLFELFTRILTFIIISSYILYKTPLISASILSFFTAYYFIVYSTLQGRAQSVGQELKVTQRKSMIAAQQFLAGIKPITVNNCKDHFVKKFLDLSKRASEITPKVPLYSSLPRFFLEPLAIGGFISVIIIMAIKGQNFTDIIPTLAMLVFASYKLLPSLQLIYGDIIKITSDSYTVDTAEEEIKRLHDVNQIIQPQPKEGSLKFENSISIQNLSFKYPQAEHPVLDNISASIPINTSLGVIGSTGSGKSTLVDTLLGLHSPTSGSILVDDVPIQQENIANFRELVGYVPQDIFLVDESIASNIAFGIDSKQIDHERVRQAARAAQILEFIEEELPQKWKTIVGERGVRLSGGQRQRIGLARALYKNPQLLILDEATSALDVETEREVMKAITALEGKITMIIIAHRLSTIESCSSVLNLDILKKHSSS